MVEKCLCCNSNERKFIGVKDNFKIAICNGCQTLYAVGGEQLTVAEEFNYDDYYSEISLNVPAFVRQRLTEIVRGFEKFRQTNKFLDVGCGAGTIMTTAKSENWQVEGTEVSAPAVEYVRKNGFSVFHGDLLDADFAPNSYDVITAVEVLEHVPDPRKMLIKINELLRPGGLFWATTPHGHGLSARVLGKDWTCVSPPEHLHLFSVEGVKILLKDAGFNNLKIYTHGTNPAEIYNAFKPQKSVDANQPNNQFDRVQTCYQLNEALTSSSWRKTVKSSLNSILNVASLGDSLKIWAIK